MRTLREMLRRTRSSFLRISGGINGRLTTIEHGLEAQRQRLQGLKSGQTECTHSLEVNEDSRKENEIARHGMLSDKQLRADLNNQYGPTKWAKKLINEIMAKRAMIRGVGSVDSE